MFQEMERKKEAKRWVESHAYQHVALLPEDPNHQENSAASEFFMKKSKGTIV